MLQTYRVRAYDGDYEVMSDQRLVLALDLDTPLGTQSAVGTLESLRHRVCSYCVRSARDRERAIDRYRLTVSTLDGVNVMDWIGA